MLLMKGALLLGNKKGSVLYSMMVLVLCSTILVRNYRLFRSHVYIEDGIYSMDVRVNAFLEELLELEAHLGSAYGNREMLQNHLKSGRKIFFKHFTITYDSSYNKYDVFMISVWDSRINYFRKVLVEESENGIILINKGV